MATYLVLGKFTDKGATGIKEVGQRLAQAKAIYQRMGGELKGTYVTLGQYDVVHLAELPDDEAMAKVAVMIGQIGNLHTESLRAIPAEEFVKLVASLPVAVTAPA